MLQYQGGCSMPWKPHSVLALARCTGARTVSCASERDLGTIHCVLHACLIAGGSSGEGGSDPYPNSHHLHDTMTAVGLSVAAGLCTTYLHRGRRHSQKQLGRVYHVNTDSSTKSPKLGEVSMRTWSYKDSQQRGENPAASARRATNQAGAQSILRSLSPTRPCIPGSSSDVYPGESLKGHCMLHKGILLSGVPQIFV